MKVATNKIEGPLQLIYLKQMFVWTVSKSFIDQRQININEGSISKMFRNMEKHLTKLPNYWQEPSNGRKRVLFLKI